MQLKTSTAEALEVGGDKAKYDAQVKNFLSNKPILAWVLKYTTEEFQNYDIETIINCIEGEIDVQKISVNPGKSNRSKITGINTEDKVPDEGEITYDIRFHVLTPEKERIKLIINIEAQKEYYTVYDIVTRGIFYCSRMISSQLDTEFEIPYYDDIKKVYSIWNCSYKRNAGGDEAYVQFN